MGLASSYGTSSQTQVDALRPETGRALDAYSTILADQAGQGVDPYQGQIAPGTSALQQQGFGALAGQGQQAQDYQSAISGMLRGDPAYGADPAARQGLYEAQSQQSLRNFQQNIMPAILEQYNAQGLGRSGGIEQALAGAGGELALQNREFGAGLEYQDELSRRAAAETARGQGIQGYQSAIEQLLGAGAEQRGIQGEQLAEEYQRYEAGQGYNNPWLQLMGPVFGTKAYDVLTESKEFAF